MGTLSCIMSAPALNLYRRILRLHRWKLPSEMRHLGDSYVREEFRLHRTANAQQVDVFMKEWKNYAGQLDGQTTDFGQEMNDDDVMGMTDEQRTQLHKLRGQSGQDS